MVNEEQNKYQLPKDWKWMKLGEVCEFSQGIQVDIHKQSNENKNGFVRFLRIIDFTQDDEPLRYIEYPGERYFLKKEDIAMVRYGTVGFVCTGKEGVIANNLFKIIPDKSLEKKYLINFLNSHLFKGKLKTKGATMQALSFGMINPIPVPIPSHQTQQLIVSKIEELFSELDKGIENLRIAQQQLKTYRQAVLKYAFEGKLTNDEMNIKVVRFGDVVKVVSGTTPKGLELCSNKGTFHFYKVSDMNNAGNELDMKTSNLLLTKDEVQNLKIKLYPKGTIIFPKRGGAILTNKKRMLSIESAFDLNIMGALPNEKVNPKYLFYWFQKLDLSKIYDGSNVPQINNKNIEPLEFHITSIDIQNKIVAAIEERLTVADKLEESINQSLQQAEALRQSILKKAFEGRLIKVEPVLTPLIPIERKILAGKIVHLLHDDKYFGLTKFQKVFCIAEHHAQVEYAINYLQEIAGPYDREFTLAFRKEMVEKDWFQEETKRSMTHFIPGEKVGSLIKNYAKYFREKGNKIAFVLKLFKDKTLLESELIATIYAVWNNRLLQKKPINEKCIINDIYNWSEQKKKYTENEIKETYKWMCEVKLIPTGFGNVISTETQTA